LRPQTTDKDGNIPVQATYSEVHVTSVRCAPLTEKDFQKRLASLQSSAVTFRVGPHGETGLIHSGKKYFNYWNGADLLRKITLDLLQTEFSARPVAPGATWKPRGQFAYVKDYGLHELDLSAADIKFRSMVEVAGDQCAWITSKYVFSPLDMAASATTREGRVVQGAGNNAVAAVLEISLLLDTATHHVAWVHRTQTIDNRLTIAAAADDADDPPANDPAADDPTATPNPSDPEMDPPESNDPVPDVTIDRPDSGRRPFMSFHFREETRARLLPTASSMEWLAALRRFEQAPEPETGMVPGGAAARARVPGPLVQAVKPSVKKATRVVVDSDTLLATPAGFTRYEKALCHDAWFCATASLALPGEVKVWDDTPLRTVYLARRDDLTISVAVGPALERKYPGLTEDEELEKHARYYLSNYVWMAVKPGIGTSFSSATLDGYPGMIADFSATQRDLADIHGVLGLILTPWGKVVPVSCTSDHAPSAELQSLCENVISSVSLRR
jgi:hypothetical protein